MVWYTLFDRPAASVGGDSNGSNVRQHIPVAAYNVGAPSTGSNIRVTFRGAASGALNFSEAWVGHATTGIDIMDFDGTQTTLGPGSTGSGVNTTLTASSYAFNKTKPLVISAQITFPGNVLREPDPLISFALCSGGVSATDVSTGSIEPKLAFPKVEIFFDDPPGNPTCTITKNTGQADPTSGSTIQFRIDFNKGVTGFSTTDVNLGSSTAGGSLVASVTGSDLAYIVSVSGMLTPGNVTISIPAAAVTAVADGLPNDASSAFSVAWDPDILGPGPNVRDVTMVHKNMVRIEVRDRPITQGHYEVLSTPDSGADTIDITGAVNNGHGLIKLTTPGFANYIGLNGNIYIENMTASPVSNGAGGQKIRCQVYRAAEINARGFVGIEHARGCTEGNSDFTIRTYQFWSITPIDATHFDLDYRSTSASAGGIDTTKPSRFINTYTGGGVVMYFSTFSNEGGSERAVVHSVGGVPNATGAWCMSRSGTDTVVLQESVWGGSFTSGGKIVRPVYTLRPNAAKGGALDYCMSQGRLAKALRFQDVGLQLDQYLNHNAAIVAANYGFTGKTVTKVYRKTKPYSTGADVSNGVAQQQGITSSRHYLYLELNSNLTNGTYTITFPAATGLPPKTFTFNDKQTRCCGLHVDQNGHRPDDPGMQGYASEWIPEFGAHGGMSYADVTAWHLIDATTGAIVRSYGAPVLRATPTSIEGTVQGTGQHPWKVRDMGPPLKVLGITRANPGVVTVNDGSRLSNGMLVKFHSMSHYQYPDGGGPRIGMWQIETDAGGGERWYRVAGLSGNTFQLGAAGFLGSTSEALPGPTNTAPAYNPLDGSGFDNFATSQLPGTTPIDSAGNLLYIVNESGNRSSAYVYGLNYAAHTDPGTYYIWFPGIGVSDPIRIRQSAWYDCAKIYLRGLYHQRTGIALDGRFGTTRPLNFKNRPDQPIYQSLLPYALGNYSLHLVYWRVGDINMPVGCGGGYSPWITNTPAVQFGGHVDAGDWDTRINETCWGYIAILQVFDLMPLSAKLSLSGEGTPTCIEAGLDPVFFAGTDDLPSPLVEVIWGIEQQRLSQTAYGGVSGGMNYGEGVPNYEISASTVQSVYTWAVDHCCTMNYAMVAGKLAQMLLELGYTTLGNAYKTSAINAYSWAASLYDNEATLDAFYAPVIALAGWTPTQWNQCKHVDPTGLVGVEISNQAAQNFDVDHYSNRAPAAAVLFSLTNDTTYRTFLDSIYPGPAPDVFQTVAMYEYQKHPLVTSSKLAELRNQLKSMCTDNWLPMLEDETITYANGQSRNYWNLAFGGANNWIQNMHSLTCGAEVFKAEGNTAGAARCRKGMQWIAQHRHGANQLGLCLTNGLGLRNNSESLHLDSRHTGQSLPIGICSEGWANDFPILGVTFGQSWYNPVQHPDHDPVWVANDTDLSLPYRELYPWVQNCFPRWELFIEYYFAIEHSEYTTQQQLLPAYAATMYLHGFDGNDETGSLLETSTADLVSSPNPSAFGELVTVTVTVTGASGTPTGTVTFTVDGVPSPPFTLISGARSFTDATFSVGSHTISVTYSGDSVYEPDSDSLIQVINPEPAAADRFPPGLALRLRLRASALAIVIAGGLTVGTPTDLIGALITNPSKTDFILADGFYTGGAINTTVMAGRSNLTIRALNKWGAKTGPIGIEAQNITLDGIEATYTETVIDVTAQGARIQNCRIYGFGHTVYANGIWVRKSALNPANRIIITNNTITDWGDVIFAGGIAVGEAADTQDITAVTVEIRGNTITDGPTAPGLLSGAIQSFHPCIVSHNFIDTVSGQGVQIKTINSLIYNNEITNVLFDGALYQRFPSTGNNQWLNNLVHDCDVGIDHFMGQNVTYRGNVIYNCDHFGRIKNQGDITNLVIENNTFWNSGTSGGWIWDSTTGGFLMNTIVFQKNIWDTVTGAAIQVDPVVASAWTENNNIFWACGSVPSPLGTGSSVTNPLLTSPPTNFTATAPAAAGKGATWPIPV